MECRSHRRHGYACARIRNCRLPNGSSPRRARQRRHRGFRAMATMAMSSSAVDSSCNSEHHNGACCCNDGLHGFHRLQGIARKRQDGLKAAVGTTGELMDAGSESSRAGAVHCSTRRPSDGATGSDTVGGSAEVRRVSPRRRPGAWRKPNAGGRMLRSGEGQHFLGEERRSRRSFSSATSHLWRDIL